VRRIVVISFVAVLVVGATALDAAAMQAKTASPGKSITLHLVEKDVAFNFIDNPPRQGFNAPPLIGDQLAFTSELLTRSGAHAGFLEATCMVARGGIHASGPCYGTFMLKGGQLAGITTVSFTDNAPNHVAIVGGTGVYEGVTGSVLSVSRGENSDFSDDTFHLLFP
jgi:hypothetical protein